MVNRQFKLARIPSSSLLFGSDSASLTETDASLSANGTLNISDVDTTDVVNTSHTLSISGTLIEDPAAPSDATLLGMLELSTATILDGTEQSDNLNWTLIPTEKPLITSERRATDSHLHRHSH